MIPDRAILPMTVGLMGGFFCGMVHAILQKHGEPVLTLAVIGTAAAAASGLVSVLGEDASGQMPVAIFRALFGAALFLCVDFGLLAFMRDGDFALAAVLLTGAGVSMAMLASSRGRDTRERTDAAGQHDG
jgi:hypothetical protein